MFRILDGYADYPATWLDAPAGAGKTCLVASYVEARQLPCLWYRIDGGDQDVASFFYYMGLAVKRLSHRSLPLFTQEYVHGLAVFTLRYFEALYGFLKPDSVIVLDNYERVAEDAPLHQVISQGMSVLPETLRVIVMSRKSPPPQFASLQAADKIRRLGWNELRFSLDDAKELIRTRQQEDVSDEVLERLYEQAQGWAAGLVLMLESLKTTDIDYHLLEGLSRKEIFDYFAGEILEKADERTKEFLLKTAFLPSMTLEAAEKLTGLASPSRVLATLYEDHYFIERYLREKVAYRYHPLFREFLLSVAHTRFSPEEVRAIQREGARILIELGEKGEAVDLLIAAKDWGELVPAILDQAPALVSEGRTKTLEGWIGSLPEAIRSESAWLLYWLAVCRQPYNPDGSRLLFDRCFTLSNQTGDSAGILLAWSGAVMSTVLGQGQFRPLDPLIDWLDAFTTSRRSFPSLEIEATVARGMMMALLMGQPYHPDFRAWVDRAFMLSRSVASASLRLEIALWAAGSYMWLGDYGHWAMVLAELETLATSREPLQAIEWRYLKALALNQMGPFDESPLPFVEEGLKLSSESGVIVWAPMLLCEGCYGALDRGDFRKASDFLAQVESMLGRAPKILDLRYHGFAALYHFRSGNTRRAITHAQELMSFSPDDVGFSPAASGYCCSAILLAAAGRRDEARENIAAFRRLPQTPSRILEYTCLIAEAALALNEGAPDALDSIRRAFRIGREEGYMTPHYCWLPSLMSRLCSAALKAGIEVEYVRTMIRARGLVPEPPADVASWPWPLKIYTFGTVLVTVHDQPLSFSHKVQKRPLSLLKALIALGGKNVREDALEDLLWPDAEGDAAHIAFKTALSRLRSLLKTEGVIEVKEGKLSLGERSVWVDTRAFDTVVERVSSLWTERHTRRVVEEAEEAASHLTDLYKGDFLKTDDELWIRPTRDRLRSKCLRALEKLADIFDGAGEDDKIAALYGRLIDADIAVKVDRGRLRLAEPHT